MGPTPRCERRARDARDSAARTSSPATAKGICLALGTLDSPIGWSGGYSHRYLNLSLSDLEMREWGAGSVELVGKGHGLVVEVNHEI